MKALYALALVSTLAHADGVPLFAAKMAQDRAPVVVNTHALDANVITLKIDGKEHRFVGKKTTQTIVGDVNGKQTASVVDTWSGSVPTKPNEVPTEQATFSRDGKTVTGSITLGSRNYELRDNLLLLKGGTK